MPIFGIGLHVIIALFFAVHAIRSGRELYWLLILFMFPLFGSIVYLFAVYLPSTRIEYGVRKTVAAAAKTLDPGRELRDAKHAYDLTPTAQNRMRLAAAHLEAGEAVEAAEHYEACLQGPFANDSEMRIGAARARLQSGHGATATGLLEAVRAATPNYRAEQVALLLAMSYAQAGRQAEAKAEFESAVDRFGNFDIRAEYALWLLSTGDTQTALQQYAEINQSMKHWNKHARMLNKPMIKRLQSAFAAIPKS